jgi:hypothetical protein
VTHRALEAELGDGTLEFVGRGARVGGRHHGEGGKTIRVALNRLMEPVIGTASVSRVLIENQALKVICSSLTWRR